MAVSEQRVTRGRLLKRAGVGAAALGAGSMLTASTASANLPPSKSCVSAGGCGICGNLNNCEGSGCCFCFITTEGCCTCSEDFFCSGAVACTKSTQCPPGWSCAYTCCGGSVCAPHCGSCNHHTVCCNDAPVKPTGRTAAGK